MAEPQRGEALAGRRLDEAGGTAASLERIAPRALVNLRSDPAAEHLAALGQALGADLPRTPNRWNGSATTAVVWLGPDEWLVIAADGSAPDIEARLRAAGSADPWLAATDVSHNYTGLLLSGSAAREVLAKGCPLDLHPRSFSAGQCAQSLLAGARMLLRAGPGSNRFEILVRNSFADYTARWLVDAMAEYRA